MLTVPIHNPSKGFASTWKRNGYETPALEGDEGGAPSLSLAGLAFIEMRDPRGAPRD